MKKQKLRTRISLLALIGFIIFLVISSKRSGTETTLIPTPSPQAITTIVPVLYVIDGDSIAVSVNGAKQEVRLIGIDAPELYGENGSPQCFSEEALHKTKELLINQTVTLVNDPTQDDKDVYGRLLRYVTLPDGMNINKQLIADGFAREYTHIAPYQYQQEFKDSETDAKQNGRGLWTNCTGNN